MVESSCPVTSVIEANNLWTSDGCFFVISKEFQINHNWCFQFLMPVMMLQWRMIVALWWIMYTYHLLLSATSGFAVQCSAVQCSAVQCSGRHCKLLDPIGSQYIRGFVTHQGLCWSEIPYLDITRLHWLFTTSQILKNLSFPSSSNSSIWSRWSRWSNWSR